MRDVLLRVETRLLAADGNSPDCAEALQTALMLFDILAIAMPISQFQRDALAGPRPALTHLFSALNIAPSAAAKSTGLKSTEGGESLGSNEVSTAAFFQM